ncbi:MAG: tRNA (adenosine(37)-N6)-threonylcarbamoyltransferase complex dimerization subunit type 1 TsaB [Clostridia bacterium]
MTILSLDTSCGTASTALFRDGVCQEERFADTRRRHVETILPLMEEVLAAYGVTLAEIDLFAVNVGPGSFTGVRIGVSAVNAMAAALGKRIVPVDSLRVLAQQSLNTQGKRILAMVDAGNGNAYAAQYENGRTTVPPEAVVISDVLAAQPHGIEIIGDVCACDEDRRYPTAKWVGEAAYALQSTAVDAVVPVYLRPSQAERMWKQRQEAGKLGL